MAKQHANYADLRKILENDIGKEYADKFSDEDIKAFGDFLLAITRGCAF
jgi:hypothetical protein